MKKFIMTIICFMFLIPSVLLAEELTKGKKDTIIISKVKVLDSVKALAQRNKFSLELDRQAESLNTELINAINSLSIFQIVERDRKDDLELEQAYASVAVDPNDKDAAKMFQMSGAKFILLPEINAFEVSENRTNYHAIQRTTVSRSVFSSVIVKIVDTTTGKILSVSPSVQLKSGESATLQRMGANVATDKTILYLSKDMANMLSKKIATYLRPAKVLVVRGSEVMINRGSSLGFKENVNVDFYATEDIEDEDSGETYQDEVHVGSGVITRGDDKKSFAKLTGENLGVAKGCVVKVKEVKNAVPIKKAPAKPAPKQEEIPMGSSDKPLDFTK